MNQYIIDIETDALENVRHIWSVVVRKASFPCEIVASTTESDGHVKSFEAIRSADLVIGHNILGFDLPVLQSFGVNVSGKVFDTLVASRVTWPDLRNDDFKNPEFPKELVGSHSLKAWGHRLSVLKDGFGDSGDWSRWSPQMQAYCEQDTSVTLALYDKIRGRNIPDCVFEMESEVARVCQRMEKRGWMFDAVKAEELVSTLLSKRLELRERLEKTFPPQIIQMKRKIKTIPFNPGSRQDIARALKELYGWNPTELTPTGQPRIDESILESLDYPEAKLLCEYLLVVKRLGQISEGDEAWLKLCKNGRLHGRINTNGAVTGRATHSKPNMAQVPAGRSAYGSECRSLFVPSPGMILVGADASGLELRCLAHFLAKYDDGAYGAVVVDGDVHWENAQSFGLVKKGTKRDKGNHELEAQRNVAKSAIYALIYGAGDTKLGTVVGGNESKGASLRKSFERAVPAYKLLKDAVAEAAKRGYLIGLDGRPLPIRSQHAALNTLLQSAGALIMKKALVNLNNSLERGGYIFGKDYAVVGWIHDEFQVECRPDLADVVGKCAVESIKRAGSEFKFRVDLDGEWRAGRSWSETH